MTTQLRPARFAAYSARSARSIRPSMLDGRAGVHGRDAHADRQRDPTPRCDDGLGRDRESQTLGDGAGLLGAGPAEQHEELVAAVADRRVRVARVLAQQPRDGDERAVAGEVAVGVVDLLEAVDVEEDDRCLPTLSQLAVEVLGEHARRGGG